MKGLKSLFYHLFIPHNGNNHRAKLLHNSSIFVIILVLLGVNIVTTFIKKSNPGVLGISYSISETELLVLTNKVRQEKGLNPLAINEKLANAARLKADDMFGKNYWAHFGPDGSSPWNFIKQSGYNYVYAGENLAKGFTFSQEVIDAWMNSESHKDNIVSSKYNDIGFAIVEGNLLGEETVLIVQLFGSSEASSSKQIARTDVSLASTENTEDENIVQNNAIKPTVQPTIVKEDNTIKNNVVKNNNIPVALVKSNNNFVKSEPVFEAGIFSKSILIIIFSLLVFTLVVDLIVVERKKIPRLVGHNIDHVMIITLFILLVIFQRNGFIR